MKKENKIKSPEGIKGWLFIITSIFIIGVLFIFKKVFYYLSFIKEFYSGEILLNNYENIIAIFYSILYIISIFLVIFTLILEFTKSRRFPKMAIITVWFCLIILAIPYLMYALIAKYFFEPSWNLFFMIIILIIIPGAILTNYLIKSERVKNTFVK